MTALAVTAHCHGCDWTAHGTMTAIDKAAEKHTAPGHPTATMARPVG